MSYQNPSSGMDFVLRRQNAFSYVCQACNRCCKGKAIRVGPYEVLVLARHFGISTTEFISSHTKSGGTILRTDANGDCGFLTASGCSVHPARPLACRLYPLGMQVSPEGEEIFGLMPPHPASEGVYGKGGEVEDYLLSQGVTPFVTANRAYEDLYAKMVRALALIAPEEIELRQQRRSKADDLGDGTLLSKWMDIDGVLGEPTVQATETVSDLLKTVERHVAALSHELDLLLEIQE